MKLLEEQLLKILEIFQLYLCSLKRNARSLVVAPLCPSSSFPPSLKRNCLPLWWQGSFRLSEWTHGFQNYANQSSQLESAFITWLLRHWRWSCGIGGAANGAAAHLDWWVAGISELMKKLLWFCLVPWLVYYSGDSWVRKTRCKCDLEEKDIDPAQVCRSADSFFSIHRTLFQKFLRTFSSFDLLLYLFDQIFKEKDEEHNMRRKIQLEPYPSSSPLSHRSLYQNGIQNLHRTLKNRKSKEWKIQESRWDESGRSRSHRRKHSEIDSTHLFQTLREKWTFRSKRTKNWCRGWKVSGIRTDSIEEDHSLWHSSFKPSNSGSETLLFCLWAQLLDTSESYGSLSCYKMSRLILPMSIHCYFYSGKIQLLVKTFGASSSPSIIKLMVIHRNSHQ